MSDNTDTSPGSFHAKVIAEFRANHGRVGGMFEGASIVLVHHTGKKTGTEYIAPLISYKLDSGWAVFAANAGAPTDPQWYRNLIAHPQTTIEIGDDRFDVIARVAEGDERTRIRDDWQKVLPLLAEYEKQAAPREIPVVIFEPTA
jgi:deazaflavin-dependent oxidoreductase (nitroreductase family)